MLLTYYLISTDLTGFFIYMLLFHHAKSRSKIIVVYNACCHQFITKLFSVSVQLMLKRHKKKCTFIVNVDLLLCLFRHCRKLYIGDRWEDFLCLAGLYKSFGKRDTQTDTTQHERAPLDKQWLLTARTTFPLFLEPLLKPVAQGTTG